MSVDKEKLNAFHAKWERLMPYPKNLKLTKQMDELFKEVMKYPELAKQRGYDDINEKQKRWGLEPRGLMIDKMEFPKWTLKNTKPVYHFDSFYDVDLLEYIPIESDPDSEKVKCVKHDDVIINIDRLKAFYKYMNQMVYDEEQKRIAEEKVFLADIAPTENNQEKLMVLDQQKKSRKTRPSTLENEKKIKEARDYLKSRFPITNDLVNHLSKEFKFSTKTIRRYLDLEE